MGGEPAIMCSVLVKCLTLEAFSPEVEKRLCRLFESNNFGVCNAILRAKLADQLKLCTKNNFSTPELNASTATGCLCQFKWTMLPFMVSLDWGWLFRRGPSTVYFILQMRGDTVAVALSYLTNY